MSKNNFWHKIKKYALRFLILGVTLFLFLVIYLDSIVRDEFKQQAWNIPAKVYARPLNFNIGATLSQTDLLEELSLLGYRKKIKAVNQGEFEQYQNSFVIFTRSFQFWDGKQSAQVIEVTLSNGVISALKDFETRKQVNFLRLDPLVLGNIQAGGSEDRLLASLDNLPEYFLPALLNTEDRDFYQHHGVSLKGIARAAWSNFSAGAIRQGGSTLTQQLIKSHFLTSERSLWRKFREAIMAVLTEYHYDKKTILEAYINEVFLGQQHQTAIHGFARASQFYFDKPLNKLNLNQVALLVGMVKGPSLYNPRRNPENALKRRNLVLKQMLEQGLIEDSVYQENIERNLQVVAKPKTRTSRVPAFMGFIKRQLADEYSLAQLKNQGLKLFTTLDPLIQKRAEKALSRRVKQLEKNQRNKASELQGAMIVSDINSGDILAMVGDKQPNYVGFNRAIDAYRQTGSIVKPFVYLAALAKPEKFNLLSVIDDKSFSLEGSDGSLWTPKNYDGQTNGEVLLQDAMVNSLNIATARLAIDLGVDKVVDTIQNAGFERKLPAYPSIALGAKEMSPLEVLRLYQTLANGGVGVKTSGLVAVLDQKDQLQQRYPRRAQSRLDPESVFLVKYLLGQVAERGTAKQIKAVFPQRSYAGKTGTTNDLRDSWFAGFGGKTLSVVWVGKDDNSPTQLTGATGALQVWKDLYQLQDEPSVDWSTPDGIHWGVSNEGVFSIFRGCNRENSIPFITDYQPEGLKSCN